MGVEALVHFKDVYRQFKEVANNMIEHQQQDAMAKQQLLKDELGGGGAAVRAQEDNAPPPSVMRVNSRGMRSSSMVLRQTDDAQLNHFLSKTRSVLRRKGKILHRILVRGREEGAVRATVWCAPVVGQLLKMTERCGFGPSCVSGGVGVGVLQELRANASHSGLVRLSDFQFLRRISGGGFSQVRPAFPL